MIYLDNAATSWPKPPAVAREMARCLQEYGANPGRSGHKMAVKAAEKIFECRENLAAMFGVENPLSFVFTTNATGAINLALKGLLRSGDHVVYSSMEHNSVVRPLKRLEAEGVELSLVQADEEGRVHPADVAKEIRKNTRLLLVTHASNVTGTVNDVEAIGCLAKEHRLIFMVDASQTAGSYPVDIGGLKADLVAFSGHKGLLGPQGTGGLYIREGLRLATLVEGGTGSLSENLLQPEFIPDRYESGTLNTPGIAGLNEGLKYLLQIDPEQIHARKKQLEKQLREGLSDIPKVRIFGQGDPGVGVVSITLAGKDCQEVCSELDEKYHIAARGGLHCAYLAHKTIGTKHTGTVRFSLGTFTTPQEIEETLQAVKMISRS